MYTNNRYSGDMTGSILLNVSYFIVVELYSWNVWLVKKANSRQMALTTNIVLSRNVERNGIETSPFKGESDGKNWIGPFRKNLDIPNELENALKQKVIIGMLLFQSCAYFTSCTSPAAPTGRNPLVVKTMLRDMFTLMKWKKYFDFLFIHTLCWLPRWRPRHCSPRQCRLLSHRFRQSDKSQTRWRTRTRLPGIGSYQSQPYLAWWGYRAGYNNYNRVVHLEVEVRSEELLHQLSYAIKNQLRHPKPI